MNNKLEKQRDVIRKSIIAECLRVAYLLENDADKNIYGGYGNTYEGYQASELFAKLKELRRDSIYLEKIARGKLLGVQP